MAHSPTTIAIIIAVITVLGTTIVWFQISIQKRIEKSEQDTDPIFSSQYNQSFDVAINYFKDFSERARITFLHRLISNLSTAEAKKAIKYINQIHNL